MSFYEELLTPGDALYARGPSRREQGRSNSEGSGTAPLGQLVMYASTGAGGELILTNKTEKQLASRLLRNFVIGITCTIVGQHSGLLLRLLMRIQEVRACGSGAA
jgi:hypothetical protein